MTTPLRLALDSLLSEGARELRSADGRFHRHLAEAHDGELGPHRTPYESVVARISLSLRALDRVGGDTAHLDLRLRLYATELDDERCPPS